ncbi:hypothetical protein [Dyadobacter sp. NIV53]|uniref:hypothetical protein n=1 Tax=Dyadobacter sp. NIV53 TaxID=2861765 RepID=UPI001C8816D3|nr:hypothetical protein [Dyadobacter sp. NIV53]
MNMSNVSVFLDVALSLTFFYLIASMFVSGITEFINTIIEKRAALLREALSKLENAWGAGAAGSILQNPLISVFKKQNSKLWSESLSYIHANTFVSVILDKLSAKGYPGNLDALKISIRDLANGTEFKDILTSIGNESKDIDDFKEKLSEWFNQYMSQVTDWYKRYNRIVVWAVAALVSIVLNLDSIIIAKRLYNDPVLRNAMVEQALQAAQKKDFNSFEKDNQQNFLSYLNKKDTNLVNTAARIKPQSKADSNAIDTLFKKYAGFETAKIQPEDWTDAKFINYVRLKKPYFVKNQLAIVSKEELDLLKVKEEYASYLQRNISTLGIPMGWNKGAWHSMSLFWAFVGWALTTAALSFGAPFWFDLLIKLVNIRNVVKPANTKSE